MKKPTVTVRLPAPVGTEVKCPICEGNKCKVCEFSGKVKVKVDAKVPVQRAHIIKYIADNMKEVASELTRLYGLTPQVETSEVVVKESGTYEVIQVSSIGGACWIAFRVDELETPKYFFSYKEFDAFRRPSFE